MFKHNLYELDAYIMELSRTIGIQFKIKEVK